MTTKSDTLWAREIRRAKRRILEAALARNKGYVVATAHELGITETALYKNCQILGVETRPHREQKPDAIAPTRPPTLSGWLATAAAAQEESHEEADD